MYDGFWLFQVVLTQAVHLESLHYIPPKTFLSGFGRFSELVLKRSGGTRFSPIPPNNAPDTFIYCTVHTYMYIHKLCSTCSYVNVLQNMVIKLVSYLIRFLNVGKCFHLVKHLQVHHLLHFQP